MLFGFLFAILPQCHAPVVLIACSPGPRTSPLSKAGGISPSEELIGILTAGDYVVVDARTPEQHARNALPRVKDAKLLYAINVSGKWDRERVMRESKTKLPNLNATVLVYCGSGGIYAASIQDILQSAGYTHVLNVRSSKDPTLHPPVAYTYACVCTRTCVRACVRACVLCSCYNS